MRYARNILLCAAVALCLPTGTAHAQRKTPKASKADMAKAKNHYHRAQSYKRLGEHRKAAAEFLAAYELYKDAEFYFNAAEMFRLAGDKAQAVKYFQKYLVMHPDGRVSKAAKASMDKLVSEISVATEAQRAKDAAAAEEAVRIGRERRAKADAARKAREAEKTTDESDQDSGDNDGQAELEIKDSSTPPNGKSFKIAGLASGVAGVLSLGLGLKFGLDASSASDELSVKFDPQTEKNGQAAEKKMFIFYGVGAVALLTGGVLYYLGRGRSARVQESGRITFAPQFDGEGASFWMQGRF